jgi:hypothetical protein
MGLPTWDARRANFAHEHRGTHIQLWRLSDLRLLKTVELPQAQTVGRDPYEPRMLPDGTIFISTGRGGLYRVRGTEADKFGADLVFDFRSEFSAVPLVIGRYWVQPLGQIRQVVSLDISDPNAPKPISALQFDERQSPHWLAYDNLNARIVMANAGINPESRLWMLKFDRSSGALSIDDKFRDAGSLRPGVSFDREEWPHGRTGAAIPHGTVFSN